MSSIRRVQATNPHTGEAVPRQSKTKVYTHALTVHYAAQEAYTIAAGTYTVPKKRIRGRNIPSWTTKRDRDQVTSAKPEAWNVISFHTSRLAADKAGRSEVSRAATIAAQDNAVFGTNKNPWIDRYELVEVEVIDEGFNAPFVGLSDEETLAKIQAIRTARYNELYPIA